jgi:hypothetical protein
VKTARVASLVVLAGAIAGGLAYEAADEAAAPAGPDLPAVRAGVALPAARPEPTLASTWYCAGGTAANPTDELADHVLLIANPTEVARTAAVTVLTGSVAPAPPIDTATTAPGETTTAPSTTTTASETTSTTEAAPTAQAYELPPHSRIEVRLGDLATAPLAGAVVEVVGGRIAVEHQITGSLGRATAPCSSTASSSWSFPWGVTTRGNRELLVFMNPFPDDATVDIEFATDEGRRDTARFRGFIVPGRSVVGAYIDEDVTRKTQVSAQVRVRGGRIVVDRIQTFDGNDGRRGITLGLGVPTPALTWMFPTGETGEGLAEQMVVFNPSEDVAEVEVEVRIDDPQANVPPEPFELTVPPGRYSIIDVHAEARVPPGVGHALFVRSLNDVPITAERVSWGVEPAARLGVAASTGAPFGAPIWYLPGGGPTAERDELLTFLNLDVERSVTLDVTGLADGQTIPIQNLQGLEVAAGSRLVIRLGDHIAREDLPVVVTAGGPIVVERGLYRIGGVGMALSIGIPLAEDVVVPDAVRAG